MTALLMHKKTGFSVDPVAGLVYGKLGKVIGRIRADGYVSVSYRHGDSTTSTLAHRIIFEAAHGPIPTGMQIDHINGIPADNRLCNLRLITESMNKQAASELRKAKLVAKGLPVTVRNEMVRTEATKTDAEWADELDVCEWVPFIVREFADMAILPHLTGCAELPNAHRTRRTRKAQSAT